MKKIAIIGHGVVGKGMEKLFKKNFDVFVYDVKTQPDKSLVSGCDLAIVCVPTNQKED
jgi:3-hydroxyisobutyrate dehydrogenase-like beta-hydroxyacid dehydrogenase